MRSSTHSLVAYEKCSTSSNFCCVVAILGKIIYMLRLCSKIYPGASLYYLSLFNIWWTTRIKCLSEGNLDVAHRVLRVAHLAGVQEIIRLRRPEQKKTYLIRLGPNCLEVAAWTVKRLKTVLTRHCLLLILHFWFSDSNTKSLYHAEITDHLIQCDE